MDRFAKLFGARVKRARIERGMTQSQLATMSTVGANYVPRIERGEMTPSVDAAHRMAQALGVSLDDLCGASPRKDALQDAARTILAISRGDGSSRKRALRALDELRGKLRDGKPAMTDGHADGAPRTAKSTTRDDV